MKQKKPAPTPKGKAKHDPAKTVANRARRIAAEQRKQAEARQRKAEQALTHARAIRRAQEQLRIERTLNNVYEHGKAAEIHRLIRRPGLD